MRRAAIRRRGGWGAAVLLALLAGGCVGDGAPRTAVSVDPDKPRDTCQHTMEGGQPRTVCY